MAAVLLIFTILISAFFDAMGTSVGLATEAGTIKDGQIENVDKVLLVDALGSVVGGGTSSSSSQIFVESATGIGAGARTGFANASPARCSSSQSSCPRWSPSCPSKLLHPQWCSLAS